MIDKGSCEYSSIGTSVGTSFVWAFLRCAIDIGNRSFVMLVTPLDKVTNKNDDLFKFVSVAIPLTWAETMETTPFRQLLTNQ